MLLLIKIKLNVSIMYLVYNHIHYKHVHSCLNLQYVKSIVTNDPGLNVKTLYREL